jgi:hypothetical protein
VRYPSISASLRTFFLCSHTSLFKVFCSELIMYLFTSASYGAQCTIKEKASPFGLTFTELVALDEGSILAQNLLHLIRLKVLAMMGDKALPVIAMRNPITRMAIRCSRKPAHTALVEERDLNIGDVGHGSTPRG